MMSLGLRLGLGLGLGGQPEKVQNNVKNVVYTLEIKNEPGVNLRVKHVSTYKQLWIPINVEYVEKVQQGFPVNPENA